MSHDRRSAPLLPALLAAACLCLLASQHLGAVSSQAFLTPSSAARGRTAMRGFKEDFDAWRSSLTAEEQELVQRQATGEFNKKFRKSEDFKKDIPDEKMKSFSKILGKFFDAEAEDYKKEVEARVPNYNRLLEKAGDKVLNFELKKRIVEIDRDADRRYTFATRNIKKAEEKGELYPESSPQLESWGIKNQNAEDHEKLKKVMEAIKEASEGLEGEDKKYVEEFLAQGVPAMGEDVILTLPQVLVNQLHHVKNKLGELLEEFKANHTEAEVTAVEEALPSVMAEMIEKLGNEYVDARDEVEEEVDLIKSYYRSQSADRYKTKADVLRAIWAELPKAVGREVPPVDEELMAELEQEPAVVEGEFRHIWGTADKLYKSEAVDTFGMKYLLGVFETKDEATKAFEDWNAEYEKARGEMKSELEQWSKQENARLDADPSGAERIKKILEEARR